MSHFDVHEQLLRLLDLVGAAPTRLRVLEDPSEVCCALHEPIRCGMVGATGCVGWSPGSHVAIKGLYLSSGSNHYCGTMVGQRVLDNAVVKRVLSGGGRGTFIHGAKGFSLKVTKGFPAMVRTYGAGYCYLLPYLPTGRSRSARILGPLPLVADFVRIFRFLGSCECPPCVIVKVSDGVYHVDRGDGPVTIENMILFLKQIYDILVVAGLDVKIGMDGSTYSDGTLDAVGFSYPLVSLPVSFEDRCGYIGSERVMKFKGWLLSHGLAFDDDDLFYMSVATCSRACLPLSIPGIKERVKLWAMLGDAGLRFIMINYCVSRDGSVSSLEDIMKSVKNVFLAQFCLDIGLYGHMDAAGLQGSSKAVADVFEALIGIMMLRLGLFKTRGFIVSVGLLDESYIVSKVVSVSDKAFVDGLFVSFQDFVPMGLNSYEYEKAIDLKRKGML